MHRRAPGACPSAVARSRAGRAGRGVVARALATPHLRHAGRPSRSFCASGSGRWGRGGAPLTI
eukprot:10492722-Alexandrium_andersonii.AAC.1